MIPVLFAYVAVATWVAWLADRRGRNFWVYLIFCIAIPGAALIAAPYLLIFVRKRRPGVESAAVEPKTAPNHVDASVDGS